MFEVALFLLLQCLLPFPSLTPFNPSQFISMKFRLILSTVNRLLSNVRIEQMILHSSLSKMKARFSLYHLPNISAYVWIHELSQNCQRNIAAISVATMCLSSTVIVFVTAVNCNSNFAGTANLTETSV